VASGVLKKPEGNAGPMRWALMAASIAVSLLPAGIFVAHVIDRFGNGIESKAKKKALTDWYRNQIANQLGIDPGRVTYRDLELAAQSNSTFRSMLDKVTKEEDLANRASLVGTALAIPVSPMPFVGGAAKVAAVSFPAMATQVGGTMAAGMLTKDELMVDDVSTMINEKRLAGQPITAGDVFTLRLAHDKPLQDSIKKQHGKRFHKMTPQQQEAVMHVMPEMAAAAEKEAYAVNNNIMTEQDLVVATGSPPSAGGFAPAGRGQQKPSFREQVDASRAAAGGMQLRPA
jgi:hypothetical protein